MKIGEILSKVIFMLKDVSNPKLEAEYILSTVLVKDRLALHLDSNDLVDHDDILSILDVVDMRLQAVPLQYIFGFTEFYGRVFKVSEHVLIPRPESELLIENVLALSKNFNKPKILEIGLGSGALAITVALENPDAQVTAVEISEEAIAIAMKNFKKHMPKNLTFIQSDLFSNIKQEGYDIIFSNPPYVSEEEYEHLDEEVKQEPKIALIAKNNGLEYYEKISAEVNKYLSSDGYLLFEIGHTQAHAVSNILKGFKVNIFKDYANRDRIVLAKKI